ncbi:Opacity protein antigens [Legionella massiliensis]|uniref:Opacity protein antigens n=1 Tax=Legionella massiliensis TaxID=1034943 RepID=A0A078KTB4_9GAMM|nr:outer membrane beta-barrel protein [Legionella massiliensis]CDZ76306.1 Opacity protein antigens [Legionella massiliensis]CEE12044.1 Sporulation related domain protein [Legionella massiliensis]
MKRLCFRVAALLLISTAAEPAFSANTRIYGLKNAQSFHSKAHGPYYIQLEYFSSKRNAYHYKEKIQAKTNHKISIETRKNHFAVVLGPLQSSAEVREVSHEISGRVTPVYKPKPKISSQPMLSSKPMPSSKVAQKETIKTTRFSPSKFLVKPTMHCSGCYLGIGVGEQWNDFDRNILVSNGSGSPRPNDVDRFSTNQKGQTQLAVSGGYRWSRDEQWLPNYSLGLQYKHIFAKNVGQTIMQYSLPEFTNYNYDWKLQSNVILANTKLNIVNYSRFSPYLTGGIGVAFNNAHGYKERALPDVTPRVSPAFSNHASNEFAFNVGAGLDYQLSDSFLLSLAYEYQDLGKVSSGNGRATWAGQNLHMSSYASNGVLLSLSYLFGEEYHGYQK